MRVGNDVIRPGGGPIANNNDGPDSRHLARQPIDIGDGGRRWTMRVKPGIFFTDDPAFKGKPRELVAEDYVYSYKRWLDPNGRRGGAPILTDLIVGARPAVDAARASGKFDYDRPVEGLRALDRYTLQLRLIDVDYANVQDMIGFVPAAAREVIESAGSEIGARAVGTGPFRLREWKRGSRIVLDANPGYRKAYFPASGDPARAALVKSMQGKTVPAVSVVEVNIIDEEITRLLQFEQGGIDYLALRGEIASRLLLNGTLKPEYAARGVTRHVFPEPYLFSFNFNIADPVIGGMSNDRVALRRAIGLAFDLDTLVKVVYGGAAIRSRVGKGAARSIRLFQQGCRRFPHASRRQVLDHHRDLAFRRVVARDTDAVEEEHGCDRAAHGLSCDAVPGRDQGNAAGTIPDYFSRLRRLAVGLPGAAAALQQAAAENQRGVVQPARI